MGDTVQAYPLQWPVGWRRTEAHARTSARFSKGVRQYSTDRSNSWVRQREVTIADGRDRVHAELRRMGCDREEVVISSNLRVRLDGGIHAGASNPVDPGVAVYWRAGKATRCMAIDRYDRAADNLAAIAATLEAMRAIERHGGAEILDRAFTGFVALPAPEQWFQVLGISATASRADIEAAYKRKAMEHHPDRPGGSHDAMARINTARDDGLAQVGA